MRYMGYKTGRPKSAARLHIEQSFTKDWLTDAYHTDGLRYIAESLSITPWAMLRIIDSWGITRLGNSQMAPNARMRMAKAISFFRRSKVSVLARELTESLKAPMPEFYPFINGEIRDEHELVVLVHNAVPRHLPKFQREDICQGLLIAILEGQIETSDLSSAVPEFIKRQYRLFPTKYAPLSLDAPIRQDGEGDCLRDFIVDPQAEQDIYDYVGA